MLKSRASTSPPARVVMAAAALLLVAACSQSPSPESRSVSGTLKMGSLSPESLPIQTSPEVQTPSGPEYVPGEVLVKFKPRVSLQSVRSSSVNGVMLQQVRSLGLERVELFKAEGSASVSALVASLKTRPDVEWAQPNYLMYPLATPDDKAYPFQWHYPAINLPQAWDLETGNSNPVTVAVVDSGILSQHPDFAGKLLLGYDFITDPTNSADGNGRDNNPEDVRDPSGKQTNYHGSHVAGTVAAATNDGSGMAGVSWGAKILPVRVLGTKGGTMADILDGVLWAAGRAVPRVPANPNPAQVINLSLGGERSCTDAETDLYGSLAQQGVIVVVAAGNENDDASNYSPSSCPSVITVGATQFSGVRTRYSNFGKRIDVMAPGGDVKEDLNGDQNPDGVLSAGRIDETGEWALVFKNGTSMAAPHVAGVVALMKARKPSLTHAEVLAILKQTARPLSAEACTSQGPAQTSEDCGAGLIDAEAALKALDGGNPGPNPQPDFVLSLSPNSLVLKPGSSANISVKIAPSGGFNSPVTFSLSGQPTGVMGTFSNSTLTLTAMPKLASGNYGLKVSATGGGKTKTATLSLRIEGAPAQQPTLEDTVVLACYFLGEECDTEKSQVITISSNERRSPYRFDDLAEGEYVLLAWKDSNQNKEVDNGDWLGVYVEDGDLAFVEPPRTGLGIDLERVTGIEALAVSPKVWRLLERR